MTKISNLVIKLYCAFITTTNLPSMACCNPAIVAEIISQGCGPIAGNTQRDEENSRVTEQNDDRNTRTIGAIAQIGGESKIFTVRAISFSGELFNLR